jgi:acyl-[acyl-carrier-protein]-phospholipid O-acyltransferase/long-chain-fatty-acid--[acyl-carrier-protein] ligase
MATPARNTRDAVNERDTSELVFPPSLVDRTVFEATVAAARANGLGRTAVSDPNGELSYRRLLLGARILGRKMMRLAPPGGSIGVMLPNANGAAATVLGLMSAGRLPAMINFTAGASNILSACQAASVTTVLTSRAFVARANLERLVTAISPSIRLLYLEDLAATIGWKDKLRDALAATRPLVARTAGDPAVILFTSGSEGRPKGVVLSHRNLLANVAQAAARVEFGPGDTVFSALPMFHCFGLTIGFIMPLVSRVKVYFYPSPLHYRIVPEQIGSSEATILFSTDTFLGGYARAAQPNDFRTLRFIMAGGEPVREVTRRTFLERFGVDILEGYGVTEAAPALAINTPLFNKPGTVGRLMPGLEIRLESVPGIVEGGRLFVRGPNVMLGYLTEQRPGELQPTLDGWHDTGDIVSIDSEGFVTIKGRARRFVKIGGEMISLAAIEALAAELWPDHRSAAIAVADPRKGERVLLATDQPDASRAAFQAHAKASGASELMIPSEFLFLPELPVLGSGKVDNATLANMIARGGSGTSSDSGDQ